MRAASGDVGVDQFTVWGGVFAFVLGVLLFAFQWAAFANEVFCVQSCGAIILSLNLRAVRRDSGVIRGIESCDRETEESLIVTCALRANLGADLAVSVHILVRFQIFGEFEEDRTVALAFLFHSGNLLRAAHRNLKHLNEAIIVAEIILALETYWWAAQAFIGLCEICRAGEFSAVFEV